MIKVWYIQDIICWIYDELFKLSDETISLKKWYNIINNVTATAWDRLNYLRLKLNTPHKSGMLSKEKVKNSSNKAKKNSKSVSCYSEKGIWPWYKTIDHNCYSNQLGMAIQILFWWNLKTIIICYDISSNRDIWLS